MITTAILATLYFGGNYRQARRMLLSQGYMTKMLSKSRFSRRLHRIKPYFLTLFNLLAEHWKALDTDLHYAIDTLPVIVCDNYHIPRAKLYQVAAYRGYQASKKRFYYGPKLLLMTTETGQPIEFFLTPANVYDGQGLFWFDFDLPVGSWIVGDKAYTDYEMEDILAEAGFSLKPFRKKNSKRPVPAWIRYLQFHYRKMIETTGSLLSNLLPKKIHATSALGFEFKVVLFVLACSIGHLLS